MENPHPPVRGFKFVINQSQVTFDPTDLSTVTK